MASSKVIAAGMRYLQAARVRNSPASPEEFEATAEVWLDAFGDVADEPFRAAVKAHVNDPIRGAFWPSPADIRDKLPAAVDDDVAAWDAIQARIRSGVYLVADLLDETQTKALADIGGTWALRRAEGGADTGGLRKRFLAICRDSDASAVVALRIEATPAPLRLAEDPRFGELVKRAGGR